MIQQVRLMWTANSLSKVNSQSSSVEFSWATLKNAQMIKTEKCLIAKLVAIQNMGFVARFSILGLKRNCSSCLSAKDPICKLIIT